MNSLNNKIIITMQEMMEQMDISDKTLHRMIEVGDLPEFTYGSKWSRKKGWHKAVLERHAMKKYEQSESLKNACNPSQITAEDVTVVPFSRSHRSMSKKLADLDNRNSSKKKLSGKKVPKSMRSSSKNSRVAAGFRNVGM